MYICYIFYLFIVHLSSPKVSTELNLHAELLLNLIKEKGSFLTCE